MCIKQLFLYKYTSWDYMEEDKVIRGNGTSERKEIAKFLISCTNDCHGSPGNLTC